MNNEITACISLAIGVIVGTAVTVLSRHVSTPYIILIGVMAGFLSSQFVMWLARRNNDASTNQL